MKRAFKQLAKQLLSWGYFLQRRGIVQQKVILLGHMRCGSSLMVHILTSNPDIAGYGETHLDYDSIADLEKLATNIYFTLRRIRPSRLVLDKILHNEYLKSDQILLAKSCIFPIMAREAISSVRSMVTSLPGRLRQTNPHSEDLLTMAADYYRRRLDTLFHYAEALASLGRCWYFTYDDLVERSAKVFRMLEHCLELSHPLSESYTIGPKTGIHGYGDPSDNIKRGYIDRAIVRTSIAIPERLAETLTEHYRSFDKQMRGISSCDTGASARSLVDDNNQYAT
ncbi:MAG TPA: hypothetical protein VG097_15390 [Gemmata sp.]|jgi:hypothetical protein|nr:hypothetical protein [Gemmata sp.]